MLINFCNPNQLLAAIGIQGNVITIYFSAKYNPPHRVGPEAYGFANYLFDVLESTKKNPRASDSEHDETYHSESSHLTNLYHYHFVFDRAIDQNLIYKFIHVTEQYQDKDKDKSSLRKEYEETAYNNSKNNPTSFLKVFLGVIDYTLDNIIGFEKPISGSHLPLLTTKNLKRIQTQFNNNSSSSTRIIINNYSNSTTPQTYRLSHSEIPTTQALINSTCPEITTLALTQDNRTASREGMIYSTFAGVTAVAAGFWFYHQLKEARPAQANRRLAR